MSHSRSFTAETNHDLELEGGSGSSSLSRAFFDSDNFLNSSYLDSKDSIKEFRQVFLERYLEKNKIGRKSKGISKFKFNKPNSVSSSYSPSNSSVKNVNLSESELFKELENVDAHSAHMFTQPININYDDLNQMSDNSLNLFENEHFFQLKHTNNELTKFLEEDMLLSNKFSTSKAGDEYQPSIRQTESFEEDFSMFFENSSLMGMKPHLHSEPLDFPINEVYRNSWLPNDEFFRLENDATDDFKLLNCDIESMIYYRCRPN